MILFDTELLDEISNKIYWNHEHAEITKAITHLKCIQRNAMEYAAEIAAKYSDVCSNQILEEAKKVLPL